MHDAGIEIDIRIEFAADKIFVLKRDLFKRHRKLEQGIFAEPQFIQHFVAGFAHQLGARVVVLVDAMTEAHQAHAGILVFHFCDEFADPGDTAIALDVVEHVECSFVRAAVRRAPQAGDAGRDGRERISAGRCAQTHGRCRCVLFVIGVQNKNAIECAHHHIVNFVFFGRHREHHAHEIRRVGKVIAWIHHRLANGVFVGHRGQGRQLGDQTNRRNFALFGVVQIHRIRIERAHCAYQAGHDRHRMRVAAESAQEKLHLLVHHGVIRHAADEIFFLQLVGQFAVQQ